jgi:hypothetical protein
VPDVGSVDTVDMQIASYEIDVAQAGLVVTPVVLLAAAAIWLLLATGAIGRIVLFCEQLAHRRTARKMLLRVENRESRIETAPTEVPAHSMLR